MNKITVKLSSGSQYNSAYDVSILHEYEMYSLQAAGLL